MMLVSERTRAGCSIAIVCAIIPPIDTPTTWARLDPEVVEQPERVAAMSVMEYGARTWAPAEARTSIPRVTRPATLVERPTSRLSKRIT